MNAQQQTEGNGPATGAVIVHDHVQEHEWNLARAFLYSLTVLTTIGTYHSVLVAIFSFGWALKILPSSDYKIY